MGIQVFSHWTRTDLTWTWNNCKIIYDIYLYSYHTIYVWQFDVNLTAYIIMLKGASNANSCRFPPSLCLSLSLYCLFYFYNRNTLLFWLIGAAGRQPSCCSIFRPCFIMHIELNLGCATFLLAFLFAFLSQPFWGSVSIIASPRIIK